MREKPLFCSVQLSAYLENRKKEAQGEIKIQDTNSNNNKTIKPTNQRLKKLIKKLN